MATNEPKPGDGGELIIRAGDAKDGQSGGNITITGDKGGVILRAGDGGSLVMSEPNANNANNSRLFPGGFPENADIRDLVCKLDAAKQSEKSDNEIAREFTGETKGHDKKAKSLLSQIRRLKREGKVNL